MTGVSECCLTPIQQYHGENKLIFDEMMMRSAVNFIGGGNQRNQVADKLYHRMVYQVHLACAGFELATLVVIGTDYIGSCIYNYHAITTALDI